jgi:DNA-binding GntR family transcriptional regulator
MVVERILLRKYPPGDTLTEQRLHKEIKAPLAAARSILHTLRDDFLLESRGRAGMVVRDITEIDAAFLLSSRITVEPKCALLLHEKCQLQPHVTNEAKASLARLVELTEQAATRPPVTREIIGFIREDMKFHIAIGNGTANPYFAEWVKKMNTLSMVFQMRAFDLASDPHEHMSRILEDHRRILTAIEDGSREDVREAIRAHLEKAACSWNTNLAYLKIAIPEIFSPPKKTRALRPVKV